MDDYIVHGHAVRVVALHIATPGIPDLHRAVFGRGDEPLGLAVERDAGDVGRVPVKGEDGVGVGGLDIVELDGMVAGGGKVAFVRGDAEAVYLRVRVGDGAGADAAEGFPEALGKVSVGRKEYMKCMGKEANRMVWSYPANSWLATGRAVCYVG